MLNFLRTLLIPPDRSENNEHPIKDHAPEVIEVAGASPFPLAASLIFEQGLPVPNWEAVNAWINGIDGAQVQTRAWASVELGWLSHLCAALGPQYRLTRSGEAVVLSSLTPDLARKTAEFMTRTLARIGRVLDGVAQTPEWGYDILLVFDDDEAYFRYISRYYPEAGEFAISSGLHIGHGCGHFVTLKGDLREIEPVIVHEMTHSCLSHLPIPTWLNEGLAVNVEQRLSPSPSLETAVDKHRKHRQFWGEEEIQAFWSGRSFLHAGKDDHHALSYGLASILVSQFARDWETFKAFANEAHADDSGQQAARRHLGLDLGAAVCALLERPATADWEPRPERWLSSA